MPTQFLSPSDCLHTWIQVSSIRSPEKWLLRLLCAFWHCKNIGGWSKTNNYNDFCKSVYPQKACTQSVYPYTLFSKAGMQSVYLYTHFYKAGMQSMYPYPLFREAYGNYFIACLYSVEHTRFFSERVQYAKRVSIHSLLQSGCAKLVVYPYPAF
jgi:hypothetical protein